jgi:hypothetical protein
MDNDETTRGMNESTPHPFQGLKTGANSKIVGQNKNVMKNDPATKAFFH